MSGHVLEPEEQALYDAVTKEVIQEKVVYLQKEMKQQGKVLNMLTRSSARRPAH